MVSWEIVLCLMFMAGILGYCIALMLQLKSFQSRED